MTLPVYNLNSPIAEVRQGPKGLSAYLIHPWNSFFQQLVQVAPAVVSMSVNSSPFTFTTNSNGNLIVTGGIVSNISLIRGSVIINLTGQTIIPLSIGDKVSITYTSVPLIRFLGA